MKGYNIDDWCKACGAPIKFVRTEKGKACPCNSTRVEFYESADGYDRVMTEGGRVAYGFIIGEPCEGSEKAYVPHFATCPRADKFRKAKPKKAKPKARGGGRGGAAAAPAPVQMSLF